MALSTETNWDTFYNTLSREPYKMAKAMYLYLTQNGFDQKEAQLKVYGHFDYNYVSIIMQCYNFSGRNGRKFSGTKLGGVVIEEDVLAFVKAYPNGIADSVKPGSGIEMENFLRERIAKRNAKSSQLVQNTYNNFDNDFDDDDDFNNDYRQNSNSFPKNNVSDDVLGIISVVVIVLILALVFNWFGLRTMLAGALITILTYGWVIGMIVFLIMLFLDKFRPLECKGFIIKIISYVATFIVTRIILVYVVAFLSKFQ